MRGLPLPRVLSYSSGAHPTGIKVLKVTLSFFFKGLTSDNRFISQMGEGPIPLVPWATGLPGESPRGLREVCTKARGAVRGSGNWLCGLTRFAGELPQDTHPQHLCL